MEPQASVQPIRAMDDGQLAQALFRAWARYSEGEACFYDAKGRLLWSNRAASSDGTVAPGTDIRDSIAPEHREAAWATFQSIIFTGEARQVDYQGFDASRRSIRCSSRWAPVRSADHIIGMLTLTQPTDGRGEMEAALERLGRQLEQRERDLQVSWRHEEKRLAQRVELEQDAVTRLRAVEEFFDQAPVPLNRVALDGTILRANQEELDLLGYAANEYVGHNVTEFHVDADVGLDVVRRLANHEVLTNYEARLRRKDGSTKTVLLSSRLQGRPGEALSVGLFSRDVSDERRQEEALRRAKELLEVRVRERALELGKLSEAKQAEVSERERAESELATTVSLLNATLDAAADGLLVVDLEGRIQTCNQKFLRLWHLSKSVVTHGHESQAWQQIASQLRKPEQFQEQMDNLRLHPRRASFDVLELVDGRVFERYSFPQRSHGKVTGEVWSFRDVTQARNQEQAIRQESHTVQLFQKIAVAVNQAVGPEQAVTSCLELVCRHTGWNVGHAYWIAPDGNLLPSDAWFFDDPARYEAFRQVTSRKTFVPGEGIIGRAWQTGRAVWVEDARSDPTFLRAQAGVDVVVRGGVVFPVFVGSQIKAVIEIYRDTPQLPDEGLLRILTFVADQVARVLERDHAEHALKESEERHRLLVAGIQDYAVFMLDPEGRVASWNEGANRLYGRAPESALGKPFDAFFPPEEGNIALATALLDRARREGRVESTGWRLRADATRFWALDNVSTLHGADGSVRGFVQVTRDLTEQRRAEQELAEKTKELLRANGELEQFAYAASHDLQEPLRIVAGYLNLLQRRHGPMLPGDAKDFIHAAVEGTARMQRLINHLLEYSRLNRARPPEHPVALDASLAAALSNLQISISEAGATVTQDPLPVLRVDGSQMVQLFQNLVGNAIKFRGDRPPVIHIGAVQDGDAWRVTVRDNGIGIQPLDHERVFELFQRLHPLDEYPGTGLGLSICKKIVERHGGTIGVESQVGAGSTFWFRLPATTTTTADAGNRFQGPSLAELTANPTAKVPHLDLPPGPPLRVILIDDVAPLRNLLRISLEESGRFHVIHDTDDGPQAIEAAKALRPDLVILDLSMPRMHGLEVLPRLLAAVPGCRVAILSESPRHRLESVTLELGAAAYIEKSLPPAEIAARLLEAATRPIVISRK